jgi:uncharacterized protein
MATEALRISISDTRQVSGLMLRAPNARACFVFAHGAGAGMSHPFMESMASGLGERAIASLRYQFPYMESGSKRPDPPNLAQAAVRAAVAEAARRFAGLPLFAGGKSFGGRMTSQAEAAAPMAGLKGLAFLGFPLHPAGRPSVERAAHLAKISVPMLFLQGARDPLADADLMVKVAEGLGHRATLKLLPGADHSFQAPARSDRGKDDIRREMLDAFAAWVDGALSGSHDAAGAQAREEQRA